MQWVEPLLVATRTSGNLQNGIHSGVKGSYRLLNNHFSKVGTVRLRLCDSEETTTDGKWCLRRNEMITKRTGFINQCYQKLIASNFDVLGAKYNYFHPLTGSAVDFKTKSDEHQNQIAGFYKGFEYRIMGQAAIAKFASTLEVITLLTVHAQKTFADRDLNKLDYVNIDDDELAKTDICKKCYAEGRNESGWLPCNAWQVTMADVFRKGYRAEVDKTYIDALEKNLALDFWTNEDTTKAFAYEVSEALIKKLYEVYSQDPLFTKMLGYQLDSPPQKQIYNLEEWSLYFGINNAKWENNREFLIKKLSKDSESKENKIFTKDYFIEKYISGYFNDKWIDAYDDIIFYLKDKGLIDFETKNAQIIKLKLAESTCLSASTCGEL